MLYVNEEGCELRMPEDYSTYTDGLRVDVSLLHLIEEYAAALGPHCQADGEEEAASPPRRLSAERTRFVSAHLA